MWIELTKNIEGVVHAEPQLRLPAGWILDLGSDRHRVQWLIEEGSNNLCLFQIDPGRPYATIPGDSWKLIEPPAGLTQQELSEWLIEKLVQAHKRLNE